MDLRSLFRGHRILVQGVIMNPPYDYFAVPLGVRPRSGTNLQGA